MQLLEPFFSPVEFAGRRKFGQAAMIYEQGKGWCLWETDTAARKEGIMAEFPNIHKEVIPVKLLPQIM